MKPKTCENCKYFKMWNGTTSQGTRHRYPDRLNVSYNYWCGEFKEKK
jgi:hypothetical protein